MQALIVQAFRPAGGTQNLQRCAIYDTFSSLADHVLNVLFVERKTVFFFCFFFFGGGGGGFGGLGLPCTMC